ncbi:HNH endonuclease family protein [Streptomyces sp. NPDC050560]|uniref:HNH endonuclease family protein n=1 Tax=Streptomyces sp. NPDC050560 TaxID=3365630 RepID=UPI00378803FA
MAVCAVLALGVLTAGCDQLERDTPVPGGSPTAGGATGGPASGTPDGHAVSPLDNADGTRPGLAPVTSDADEAKALRIIGDVPTKGRGPKTGYARDEFGYAWMDTADGVPLAHNGCDTRDDLIRRDGQDLRFRSGSDCVVVSMTLHDPYTGTTMKWKKEDAADVQIDHVVPLSYSWQMGASRWPKSKREQLANDVLNLIPVQGRANSAKRDSGPASWLPPDKHIRCAYAVRFGQVALKYHLPVTPADAKVMRAQCGG